MTDAPQTSGTLSRRDRSWQPPSLTPDYKTTRLRAPTKPLVAAPSTLSEQTGPAFGHDLIGPLDHDLMRNYVTDGEAVGQRIIVHGRIMDENGRAVPNALVEMWQANAGGRYRHVNEGYIAKLDPNFGGCGRTLSDENGAYMFRTILPGAYPWPNGPNSWRPAHIHFSLFGAAFGQRLITQMYFAGDPLIETDPIMNAVSDPRALQTLISHLDMDRTEPMDSLAYRFDMVLRGHNQTYFENRTEGA